MKAFLIFAIYVVCAYGQIGGGTNEDDVTDPQFKGIVEQGLENLNADEAKDQPLR
jgi:hypothetical protein